jgi:cysteine desulfurase
VIYFDHNATSPLCAAARDAWLAALERFPANPSSPHRLGTRADAALTEARQNAAQLLGCSPFDLVWTSGATEANNAVFHNASLSDASGEAWVSAIEHPSALEAARAHFGNRLRLMPVNASGAIELDWLADRLKKSPPSLVFVMAANNETGVLQPWREALRLCRESGVHFGCDASQWLGKLPSAGLGECDYLTACAHKFGGPPGVGFMKVPQDFRPMLLGGGQEDGRRAGTENLPSILAMLGAWTQREQQIAACETAVRQNWRDHFLQQLESDLPQAQLVGAGADRLWNTISLALPALPDCRRRWVVLLDKAGVAASTGSACASGKEKPSHVLAAMGRAAESDRTVRFSSGWETTEADWTRLLEIVLSVARANLG